MKFENIFVGTDIEEIARFQDKTLGNSERFLRRIFTEKELEYCFSDNCSAMHLCARYCAKEAIVKALSAAGIKDVYYADSEILNEEDGTPYAVIKKYPNIGVKISLSHTKTHATATVIVCK